MICVEFSIGKSDQVLKGLKLDVPNTQPDDF